MDCNEKDILNDYLLEIKDYKLLSKEEEEYLLKRIKKGDKEAKEKFIYCNSGLVINEAKKYRNSGLSFMELIQEGNVGLIESINKFDVTKGYKFSTYAVWWIRNHISRAVIDKAGMLRFPRKFYVKITSYNREYNRLLSQLSRVPTDEEVNENLKYSAEDITLIKKYLEMPLSSNSQIDDDSSEIIDFIASNDDTPEDKYINSSLKKDLEKLISSSNLSSRERKVLYDMVVYNKSSRSLVEKYNVSRQRITQIRDEALSKIRRNNLTEEYLVYADDLQKGLTLIKKSKKHII